MASTREEMTGFTLNQQPSTISGEAHTAALRTMPMCRSALPAGRSRASFGARVLLERWAQIEASLLSRASG